ncbi:hypothetical protein SUGI_0983500 [Cryptomeria japonica]|nr:hypothetical protein SUGI_0983500 [Cryptomeria japonica]
MAGKGDLSMELWGPSWYDMFLMIGGETKFGKSHTLFSPASCLWNPVFENWFDWIVEGDRVVQRQCGGFFPCGSDSECSSNAVVTPYYSIYRRPSQLLQVDWREILARTWFLTDLMLQFVVSVLHTYIFEHFQSSAQTVVEDFLGIAQLPTSSTCESIRCYSRHMMSIDMPLDDDWLIAMSWVGWCSRVSFLDTWRLGDSEGNTVYVRNVIVMMYDSEVNSLIIDVWSGTYWHQFWDILLRDADGYLLRWSSFHFLLPRIELGNRVSDMDLTKAPWQNILHGIDLSSLRIFSIGFDDNSMLRNHEMAVQFDSSGEHFFEEMNEFTQYVFSLLVGGF